MRSTPKIMQDPHVVCSVSKDVRSLCIDLRRTSKCIALGERTILSTLLHSRVLEFFSKCAIRLVVTVEAKCTIIRLDGLTELPTIGRILVELPMPC